MTQSELVKADPLAVEHRWRFAAELANEGRYGEALAEAKLAIRIKPTCYEAWAILGGTYNILGRFDLSLACAEKALAIAPGLPIARWNRAWARMFFGDWKGAFEDYEFGRVNKLRPNRCAGREWYGEDLSGKVIFVWGEQGLGDQIQFARFLKPLMESGAHVILELNVELVELFQGFASDVVGQPSDFHCPYNFDYHAPLLSLPHKLGIENIPSGKLFDAPEGGEGIGICWRGRATHPNDANRSLHVDEYPGDFVNLTYGTDGYQGGNDFAQLAQVIGKLEAVVTIDSAVGHLAGAMGKRVLMVPPTNNEARWGSDATTPWYDSMTIIRGHETIKEGLEMALQAV